ncbi:hypothetical protein [Burkholderia sp. Bp9140]|uniref:hypothetical protein n=1 Tax=Burkholderia sp. Bp9140 TaxID=2184572 RepID=UPI0021AB738F|nr:hypothetical protein [Burkholderia sp. Bp9140]
MIASLDQKRFWTDNIIYLPICAQIQTNCFQLLWSGVRCDGVLFYPPFTFGVMALSLSYALAEPHRPHSTTMIDFTEEQIAARELRSTAYHEAGHKLLYERFGGAGDAVVWKNDSGNSEECAWLGQWWR